MAKLFHKKVIWKSLYIILVGLLLILVFVKQYAPLSGQPAEVKAHIEEFITEREEQKRLRELGDITIEQIDTTTVDPFGTDDRVKILLIGLDTRLGSSQSHCDAIQRIDINKKTNHITITAVPRGTYAPLPGGPYEPGAYYVSNSCAIGGIPYGIKQIERILGEPADYVVFVGFSEVLGILDRLQLPTTETLQWLRHRQGYAIGEPQRARNHSTFIKQMMQRFVPEDRTTIDTAWYYTLYKLIKTDLSFAETMHILDVLVAMDIKQQEDAITLAMRPAYTVADIAYDEEQVENYVNRMVKPISRYLSREDYQQQTEDGIEYAIMQLLKEHEADEAFLHAAFEQKIWFQIHDESMAEAVRYHLLTIYLEDIDSSYERQKILTEYIIEMEQLQKDNWEALARELLEQEFVE